MVELHVLDLFLVWRDFFFPLITYYIRLVMDYYLEMNPLIKNAGDIYVWLSKNDQ